MRLGADEAGKGPVLGSMFAAAVRANPAALPDNVGDSKGIPPARREELAGAIRDRAEAVAVCEIPVERIDDPETDMNVLTVEAQASALADVARAGDEVLVDAGDTNAERFGRRVAAGVDADVALTARHGADEVDPVVGSASIVAKVARDAHVAEIGQAYGAEVGSGYPSDEVTRSFLRSFVEREGELPECARSSWQTCDDVLAAVEQSALGEF